MKRLLASLALACLCAAPAALSQTFYTSPQDQGIALRVFPLTTNTVTIGFVTNSADTTGIVAVTVGGAGGFSNVFEQADGYGTAGALADFLASATNAAGTPLFRVDRGCSLAADIVTNGNIAAGVYTNVGATPVWTSIKWSTADCLHYDVYVPTTKRGGHGGLEVGGIVRQVYGNPGGTGAATAYVYVNGTLRWMASLGTDAVVTSLPKIVCIPFRSDEPIFYRVTRATTATTGAIGFVCGVDPCDGVE